MEKSLETRIRLVTHPLSRNHIRILFLTCSLKHQCLGNLLEAEAVKGSLGLGLGLVLGLGLGLGYRVVLGYVLVFGQGLGLGYKLRLGYLLNLSHSPDTIQHVKEYYLRSSHGEEIRDYNKIRNTPILQKSHEDSLFNLFLKALVLRKSIGGKISQGKLRVRVRVSFRVRLRVRVQIWVWQRHRLQVRVRVRVSFRVRAMCRVRVRIRVRVRVRVGVRVRVRVRVRLVIKPIPLSRYPLVRKGILFEVQPWRRVQTLGEDKEHTHYQEITLGFSF